MNGEKKGDIELNDSEKRQKKYMGKWEIIVFLIPFFNRNVICLKFSQHTQKFRGFNDNFLIIFEIFLLREDTNESGIQRILDSQIVLRKK